MSVPSRPVLAPALVAGFSAAIGLWVVWFVTHLPWLSIPERFSVPALVACWGLAFVCAGANLGRARGWKVGGVAGLVSALLGLLVLGSKLRPPVESGAPGDLYPSAPMIAAGFLGLGLVLGVGGSLIGSLLSRRADTGDEPDWLARFAIVTVVAAAPLLFVGGLVTSTGSGLAVPDWPNTFGSNMFLYPLGPRADAGVYLEHSHRLFGTLVGCTMLVLLAWVWIADRRTRVRVWATGVFVLIVAQGVLGGLRVIEVDRYAGLVHGVLAQIIFGMLVALAAYFSESYREEDAMPWLAGGRKLRTLATAALHVLFLQLLLGAGFRHLRSAHVLWTHAAFAFVALVLVVLAGFAAIGARPSEPGHQHPVGVINATGRWVLGCVLVQFALGWLIFLGGALDLGEVSTGDALMRTAHQANGALLLGVTTLLAVLARRAIPRSRGA